MMTTRRASVLLLVSGLVAAGSGACAGADDAPPVATVSVTPDRPRVALGSPFGATYRFEVAPGMRIDGDYSVFVHVAVDGQTLWTDDHQPPVPTSAWQPGQTIEYTRTGFVPIVPYLGTASISVGLYRGEERVPLQGSDPADRGAPGRAYRVATVELLPSSENVFLIYKSGWHPMEFAADPTVSWQWTQKSAVLAFRNPRVDTTLYLDYDARPDLVPDGPQTVTVSLGDQPLATLTADSIDQTLERIPVTAAQLGDDDMVELRLDVDKTFVPAQLPAGGRDGRELGIRVYHVFVDGR